jgi:carbon monoxide dehydrogenase subunit G
LTGTYHGKAAVHDKNPPDSLTLAFEGKGGPAFVRGTAAIRLHANGDETTIDCDADVKVGGVIAAVGSRLIEAAARKLSADFFQHLTAALDGH